MQLCQAAAYQLIACVAMRACELDVHYLRLGKHECLYMYAEHNCQIECTASISS